MPVFVFAEYQGSLTFNNQDIVLEGNMVWQLDSHFARSAYVSVSGFSSTFSDWDGKVRVAFICSWYAFCTA